MNDCSEKLLKKNNCKTDSNNVREFLQKKNLDEGLITEIIEQGLTDEITEKLHGQGFTFEDILTVGKALMKDSKSSSSCECDCDCETEHSNVKTFPESEYLKAHFGKILPLALREIVTRKVFNPIEYFGHWLLHYKECEDRENRQKILQEELLGERLKLQKPLIVWEPPSDDFEHVDDECYDNQNVEKYL